MKGGKKVMSISVPHNLFPILIFCVPNMAQQALHCFAVIKVAVKFAVSQVLTAFMLLYWTKAQQLTVALMSQ